MAGRDVHDSVGHYLTAIRLQTCAARRNPGHAPRGLDAIADLSGTALTEVRDLLRELDEPRDRPGLSEVERLAERLSTAELTITVRRTGSGEGPASVVDHAGYRIVQEALTNVARHSGATTATVTVHQDAHALHLEVRGEGVRGSRDRGGRVPVAKGRGLRGMRERARMVGGTLSAGSAEAGGWLVHAALPLKCAS